MNTAKNTDFFTEINERDAHLVAPDIHEPYQDTQEDFLHEKHLKEVEAQINERLGATSEDNLGELPFDEEADRKDGTNSKKISTAFSMKLLKNKD